MSDELLPCPFCGGPAELDSRQAYRNISTGGLETAVAVYCAGECSVQITHCRRDMPACSDDELIALTVEFWSRRAALSQPSGEVGLPQGWRVEPMDAPADRLLVTSREGAAVVIGPDSWKQTLGSHVLYSLIRDLAAAPPQSASQPSGEVPGLYEALRDIHDFAHDRSTGPTVPDDLWEVRRLAMEALTATAAPPQAAKGEACVPMSDWLEAQHELNELRAKLARTASPSPEAAGDTDAESLIDDLVGAALAKYRSNYEHERQKYGGQFNDARAALLRRLAPKAGDGAGVDRVMRLIRMAADAGGATEGQCFGWWRDLTAALSAPKAGAQAVDDAMVERAMVAMDGVRSWKSAADYKQQLARAALSAAAHQEGG